MVEDSSPNGNAGQAINSAPGVRQQRRIRRRQRVRTRVGQLLVLGLIAGSIPVLLSSANASSTLTNFVEIDGNIPFQPTSTSNYGWANEGALIGTSTVGSTWTRSGTKGLFDGGIYQGTTTPPTAPTLTPAAKVDPTIGGAAFIVDPMNSDITSCSTGAADPTTFSSSNKNGDLIASTFTGKVTETGESWGAGSVPAKDDLTNVYAVSHVTGTVNEIYFGAERASSSGGGDTHMDFEFLQSPISTNKTAAGCAPSGGGTFSGHRTAGDLLIVADFSGSGSPSTQLYRWDCGNSAPTGTVCDPTKGSSASYVLASSNAVLFTVNNNPTGCGGWVCRQEGGGVLTTVPQNLFFTGGIDLNAAGFGFGCFSTFLPHTRTASSVSANLADFAGPVSFSNCKTPTVATTLRSGTQSGQSITVPAGAGVSDTATLTNTTSNAAGTLTYQVFTDANCTVASTNPSVSQTVSVAADGTVQPSSNVTFPTGGTYYWQATYNGSTSGRDLAAMSPCNEVLTVQSAGVTIKKTADATPVTAGGTVGFTIGVTSTGTGPVTGVHVTDTLPTTPGTLVWTATPTVGTCTTAAGVLDCNVGTLAQGSTAGIHLTSPTAPANCGTIPNTAYVTSTNDGGGNSSASIVVACPNLVISKVANPTTITAGGAVTFTVGVTNTGTGAATGATISDPLPATGALWTMNPSTANCSITGVVNQQVLTCSGFDLAPGAHITITITTASSDSSLGSIPNTATATATNNPSVSATATVTVNKPSIGITKTADLASVSAGDQVGFTIMVGNSGSGAANGVTITDTLPVITGTSWSVDASQTTAKGCAITNNVLSCPNNTIPAGPNSQVTVHIVATTNSQDCGTLTNVASFKADNDGQGTSTPAATIKVNCAHIVVTKTPDAASVSLGDQIGFTIQVTNTATGTNSGVINVTDTLPSQPGLNWSVTTTGTSSNVTCNPISGGQLTCTVSNLTAGQTATIHITSPTSAQTLGSCASGSGTIMNSVTATATLDGTDSTTSSVTVDCPTLSITKTAASTSISAGDVASYSVTVTNTSAKATARGVTLTDTLPAGVTWAIQTQPTGNPCTITGSTLSCTFGDLGPGAHATVVVTGTTSAANCAAALNNSATTGATNLPTGQGSQSTTGASASITVNCPTLAISKTPDHATISAGDPIGFTVVVTNTVTTATVHGFTVNDPLPASNNSLTWTIASQSGPVSCAITGSAPQVLACGGPTTDFGPGAVITVHIVATTTSATGTSVSNTVTATATNAPTVSAQGTVTVNHGQIVISKTPDASEVSLGDQVGFVIQVTNTASGNSGTIHVTDTLQPGLSWSVTSTGTSSNVTCSPIANNELDCTITNLTQNQTATIHVVTPTTAQNFGACTTGSGTIMNSVTATADLDGTQSTTSSVTVDCPTLNITKTAASTSISAGDVASYSVTVTNTSAKATARGVTLTDTLPAGVTWAIQTQPTGNPCTITGSTLSCTFGDLGPGAHVTVVVTGTTSAVNCAAALNNSATTGATNLPTGQGSQSTTGASASITVNCPTIQVRKVADASPISAGDPIGFTVYVTNTATNGAVAHSLTVSDPLPAGGSNLNWSITGANPANCTISGAAGSQTLTCGPTELTAGASFSVHITATTLGATAATVSNTVTATATNNPPVSSTATVTVNHASVITSKTPDNATVSLGDQIGFTIQVTNTASGNTGQIHVTDTLPSAPGVSWTVASTSPAGVVCSNPPGPGGTLDCTLPAPGLGLNQTMTIHLTSPTTGATAGPTGCATGSFSINNSATITSANDGGGTPSGSVTVNCPSLGITKTAASASISAGDTASFSVTVTNAGPGTARGVTLTDTLPAGVTWVIQTQPAGTPAPCTITAGVLNCAFGDLAAGTHVVVTVTGTTSATNCAAALNNSATTGATNLPASDTTTAASASITVNCPNLVFTKKADSATANEGGQIGFTIQVTNTSTAGTAHGVTITDTLPPVTGTSLAIDTNGTSPNAHCAISGTTLTCNIGDMAPGAVITIHLIATTTPTTCGSVTNSAHLTASNGQTQDTAPVTIVVGCPKLTVGKSASAATALPGQVVSFTIGVTNTGNAPGSTTVTDTYAPATLTGTVQVVPAGSGTCANFAVTSTLSCQVTVQPGQTVNISYQAQMPTSFTGNGGQAPCNVIGEFPIVNHVTIDGGGNAQATVCVLANPNLSLIKSASATSAVGGQTLVFSLNYVNAGPGNGANVVVTDPLPSTLTFGSCSPAPCTNTGQFVTWTVGAVPAGTSATLTVTTTVNSNVGCSVCNQANLTASNQNSGAPVFSNNLCLIGVPGPNPAGAHANGYAVGVSAKVGVLGNLLGVSLTASQASSSQTGVGTNGNNQQVLTANIGLGSLGVLTADALRTQSNAVITASPAEARDTSVAETANLNILNGLVKATLVRAVAQTDANGSSSSLSATGSTVAGLVINGVAYADVTPNLTVGLPALVFGPNSYVAVFQQVSNTSTPAAGQASVGTYSADLQVTMIHVHISGILGVIATADIYVSRAQAHSDFPQTTLCATSPQQSVSGHAFILSEQTDPSLLPILLGLSMIPSNGGHAHTDLLNANALGVAIAGTLNTDATGTETATSSQSVDYANVANVCVIPTGVNTCAIQAKAITSKSSSTANASGASSNSTGTQFVNLKVLGVNISAQVAPNSFINLPGIGFVILNEQLCDNGTFTNTGTCTGTHHSGLTVRAIDVVVNNFQNGGILPIGAQVIVAEAHSDATFGP